METEMSKETSELYARALRIATLRRHEFITPEHLTLALIDVPAFCNALYALGGDPEQVRMNILSWMDNDGKSLVSEDLEYPALSQQMITMLNDAASHSFFASVEKVDVIHLVNALLNLPDSYAAYTILSNADTTPGHFIAAMLDELEDNTVELPEMGNMEKEAADDSSGSPKKSKGDWRSLLTCINDSLEGRNPLIGREAELERTIRVLCRKDKNNPLHIGEPGVGKTALVYGLADRIERGEVPERLKGRRIYRLDVGSLLAGTQFRGDFEKRIKMVMDGLSSEEGSIVYIDEIHTIVGAGATGEGAMDAANMLKPYLEEGKIRFIGSTTYEEFNRHLSRSKSLVRRFQQIDILEPSEEEAVHIAMQLKPGYESFHGVRYTDDAVEYAVRGSSRHLSDRRLPDKALDLIDEAGAYREIHPDGQEIPVVDRTLMSEVLSKMCKVDSLAIREERPDGMLAGLYERIAARIYGQDEAVRGVTEAVQMARAGLSDAEKPQASLLFVGPTGVGKTEVAKVLAAELGVELIRFDMSEYTEKHTVAKLIGAPAGYVGYEDGGLLTDAIRRNPNCVLLLDEIEKAHQDIYNVLLQVMDYGRLTDNKGRSADFRNVVILMTSNAGAQFASRASVGFGSRVAAGEAMLAQVKRTFKPEFINRLSGTVVFRDMDRTMAGLILDKKLSELQSLLSAKNVTMTLAPGAREWLLEEGFSKEYGARELDRVIGRTLKPLLMREILFGRLREGGNPSVVCTGKGLELIFP